MDGSFGRAAEKVAIDREAPTRAKAPKFIDRAFPRV
jgi:hypothetical protein